MAAWVLWHAGWTHAAGDGAVQFDLLDERRVAGQGVGSGHGVLVGLLVIVLIKRERQRSHQFKGIQSN